MAWGAALNSDGALGPMHREGKWVSKAVHGGRYEENIGGDSKLTRADRRSTVCTECKAGGSFYMRHTGSGWDDTGWRLALDHGRQRDRASAARAQRGRATEARSGGGKAHAVCPVAAGGDEVQWRVPAHRAYPDMRAYMGSATQGCRRCAFSHVSSASGAGYARHHCQAPGVASQLAQRRVAAGAGGQWPCDAIVHHSRCDDSRWQAHTRASSRHGGDDGWPT
jgi:hypothetical protein